MMYKKQIKKIFILSVVLFSLSLGITQAATTSKTTYLPWDYRYSGDGVSNFNGLAVYVTGGPIELPGNWSQIKININKKIKFIRESGSFIGDFDFTLNQGKEITLYEEDPYGKWTWAGYTRNLGDSFTIVDSPESAGRGIGHGYFTNKIFEPIDSASNIEVVSKNPDIVECSDKKCTALKAGKAEIVVKFTENEKDPFGTTNNFAGLGINIDSIGSAFYGGKNGYGRIKAVSAFEGNNIASGQWGNQKTIAYSLPNLSFTVTVPETPNTNQTSSCAGYENIKDESVVVKWSYTDSENDPQTNYQIQVSKNSDFSSLDMNVQAPSGDDVSNVRQRTLINLSPETKYYGRIRTYNEENGWSEYSACGTFTTTQKPPLDNVGQCSFPLELNSCANGELQNVSENDDSYTWDCVGSSSTDNCSIDKGDPGSSISGRCDYSVAYGCQYNVTATNKTRDGDVYDWNCNGLNGGSTASCHLDLTGGGGCVGDDCISCVGDNCGGSEGEDGQGAIIDFRFSPFVGNNSNTCPLYLEAQSVKNCSLRLVNSNQNSATFNSGAENSIDLNGEEKYSVGVYKVVCIGTDDVPIEKTGARCISNPDVIEN